MHGVNALFTLGADQPILGLGWDVFFPGDIPVVRSVTVTRDSPLTLRRILVPVLSDGVVFTLGGTRVQQHAVLRREECLLHNRKKIHVDIL